MNKTKATKKALLMSMLSMLICITMLIGSTFAWFTDSVTSGKNTIIAGNLDVEMEYYAPDAKGTPSWQPVTEKTSLFDESALWEPGYTQVVYLKISNVGSLSLNYKLLIDIASEKAGKRYDKEKKSEFDFLLSDYLKFGAIENEEETIYKDRAEAREAIGEDAGKLKDHSVTGSIKASEKATKYVTLVVYMPETVDNEANHYGTFAPEIDLGISLIATQMVDESDSFGNDYDADASPKESNAFEKLEEESNFTVASETDLLKLQDLVLNGNTFEGKTITLGENIALTVANWAPIGTAVAPFKGTFNGNNKTISGLTITEATNGMAGLFGQTEGATIENLTVNGTITLSGDIFKGNIYIGGICAFAADNNNTIDGCISNVTIDLTGVTTNAAVVVGGISASVAGKISNCVSNANITAPVEKYTIIAGGIAGMKGQRTQDDGSNDYNGTITGGTTQTENKHYGITV